MKQVPTGGGVHAIRRSLDRDGKLPLPRSWQVFPVDCLPSGLAGFVTEASGALGCDPAFVAAPLLAALAGCIGNSRVLVVKPGWEVPTILWIVVIAESGSLKSPALDTVMRSLRSIEAERIDEYENKLEGYLKAKVNYETDLMDWKKSGRKKGEAMPDEPKEPTCPRLLVSETTVAALGVLLQQSPRGLLLVRDELSGWVASFDARKNARGADLAHWLEFHRGGSLVIDRKGGPVKHIYVARASTSVCGTIQPGTFQRRLTEEHFESGLVGRLLLCRPPRRAKKWTDATVTPSRLYLLNRVYKNLLDLAFDEAGSPQQLSLSSGAKQVWIDFYNSNARRQAAAFGSQAGALAKIEEYAARLALIMHLAQYAEREVPKDEQFVDEESMRAGVRLAEWFATEMTRNHSIFEEDDDERRLRRLYEFVEGLGRMATLRDVTHGPREYRGAQGAVRARGDLGELVRRGVFERTQRKPGPRGGRPTLTYRLVP